MIEASFGTLLAAAIGETVLLEPGLLAASGTAIALSAITAGAKVEMGVAFLAQANSQRRTT